MNDHIIIIGGGIAGIRLASLLQKENIPYKILEAREYLGGRVLTQIEDEKNYFDLGPTLYWPEKEPTITQLIKDLNIPTMEQFNNGKSLLQLSNDGNIKSFDSEAVNSKSYRIIGGVKKLIDVIKKVIPNESIHTHTIVKKVIKNTNNYTIDAFNNETKESISYTASKVVLCLPPRLLLENLTFLPKFNQETYLDLLNKPTWMGAQSKIVLTYKSPFWREQNLSGNVISWVGPLREVYDATTDDGKAALFGFFSLSPENRSKLTEQEIKSKVVNQLMTLFGNEIQNYQSIYYKDWSQDNYMTTSGDKLNIESFPTYGPPINPPERMYFAGTEYDQKNGGHLEGALNSAHSTFKQIASEYNTD
ncbi:flavin monoamine oxidase family protein [Mammaliicoccus sciuri]|uniref:flavin monoamine oxidase family protein n=1 Tax=Mammaliicoccus sciuri TaxID=1296 RepID=UPI003F545376